MNALIFIISTVILVGIDQLSKLLAINNLMGQPSVPIIPNVLELTYVENRGAAFGMMQGNQSLFALVTVIVVIAITYYYLKYLRDKKYRPLKFCFILITAGAIGNFIDRVFRGSVSENLFERVHDSYVVDFIYFKLINFPVFNIADSYVVVGSILFALLLLTKYKNDLLEN